MPPASGPVPPLSVIIIGVTLLADDDDRQLAGITTIAAITMVCARSDTSTMRLTLSAACERSRRMSLTDSCMPYRSTGFVIMPTFSTPPSFSLSQTAAISCTVTCPSARMKTDLSSRASNACRTRSPRN